MHRREALKNLALISGGAVLVPSCNFEQDDILAAYKNLKVTESQRDLLSLVADTIIPPGEIKGAADIAVQDFILVMVNDCVEAERQVLFTSGLQAFNGYSKKIAGNFSPLEAAEKEKVVAQGMAIPDESTDETEKAIRTFLTLTKRFTIQGYMMSEYIMTQVKPYSLIPGEYSGAVLISSISNLKING